MIITELWRRLLNLEYITNESKFSIEKSYTDDVVEVYQSDTNGKVEFKYDVGLSVGIINRSFKIFKQENGRIELQRVKIPGEYFNVLLQHIKKEDEKEKQNEFKN